MRLLWVAGFAFVACTGDDETTTDVTETGEDTGTMPTDTGEADTDADNDGFISVEFGGDDCNDADASVNPDADEVCGGEDENCDGKLDVGAIDASTWFIDGDGDSFGDDKNSVMACDRPTDGVKIGGDCNDKDKTVNPNGIELCDGFDDDCNPKTVEYAQIGSMPYTSVTDAVKAAAAGDTIEVCRGSFVETGIVVDKEITIAGVTGTPGDSVFDAAGGGTIFDVQTGGDLTLSGLQLTQTAAGPAVTTGNATVLNVEDCLFDLNTAPGDGGAIWGVADLTITNSTFVNNVGGGLGGAIAIFSPGSLDITDSMFEDNSALPYGFGGAVASIGANIKLSNTTFQGNASSFGGAFYLNLANVTADAKTLFQENFASGGGGAIYLQAGFKPVSFEGGRYLRNETNFDGGAFNVVGGAVSFGNLVVDDNSALGSGGAFIITGDAVTLSNSTVSNNVAAAGGGFAAFFNSGVENLALNNVNVIGNSSGYGGGFYLFSAGVELVDSMVGANACTFGGAGAMVTDGASLVSTNTDWGSDKVDNVINDVGIDLYDTKELDAAFAEFGDAETFSCDSVSLTCE